MRTHVFIGLIISVLLPLSVQASSGSLLSPEQLLQQIDAAQSMQRSNRAKAAISPKKTLTIKQKAEQRQRKRKQFIEMLLKLEKAKESIQKQSEEKKKLP